MAEREVHFVDAAAATMPQAELAVMSKTQLIQCVMTLQAGWTAATKQLTSVSRTRELHDAQLLQEMADERAAHVARDSRIAELDNQVKALMSRNYELETEVVNLRRASVEDPDNPALARAKDELIKMSGRVLELERLLRQREPLQMQFAKIRMDELTQQRDADRLKLQEYALQVTRLEQQLRDAREGFDLRRAEFEATDPAHPASPGSFVRNETMTAVDLQLIDSLGPRALRPDVSDLQAPLKRPVASAATQTEIGTARLVELLQQRDKLISELRQELDQLTEERNEVAGTMASMQAEMSALRESEARKAELLEEITSAPLRRAGSFRNQEDIEKEQAARTLLEERLRKADARATAAEERATTAEAHARNLDVEVGRLTRSFATVAEENVQLSHSLQAVGDMSAKEIAGMLTAADKVAKLRAELTTTREQLDHAQSLVNDHEKVLRESGTLKARVERQQIEIGVLATETSKLSRELQGAYETLESQQPIVDQFRRHVDAARAASSRYFRHISAVEDETLAAFEARASLFARSCSAAISRTGTVDS